MREALREIGCSVLGFHVVNVWVPGADSQLGHEAKGTEEGAWLRGAGNALQKRANRIWVCWHELTNHRAPFQELIGAGQTELWPAC